VGARISTAVCRSEVSDPMSGYFALTRSYFDGAVRRLSGIGFKILVDLLASNPRRPRVQEVPYHFRNRIHGTSKLDINTGIEYFLLIADKMLGDIAPARFIGFIVVGSIGVVLNLAVVTLAYRRLGMPFIQAQAVATLFAMVSNFFINNATTYRDIRLRGWRILTGLVAYCIVCTFGAVANIAVAQFLVDRGVAWYLAAIFGLMIGSVWNYGATYAFTWRMLRSRAVRRRPQVRAVESSL
jgi:dolichol-phosphate mannosyltransferase